MIFYGSEQPCPIIRICSLLIYAAADVPSLESASCLMSSTASDEFIFAGFFPLTGRKKKSRPDSEKSFNSKAALISRNSVSETPLKTKARQF